MCVPTEPLTWSEDLITDVKAIMLASQTGNHWIDIANQHRAVRALIGTQYPGCMTEAELDAYEQLIRRARIALGLPT